MKILNIIPDDRINASNVLLEMTIGEYQYLSEGNLERNGFQRRRVKSSGTVYSLLKKDIHSGCVIPPLVLALSHSKDFAKEKDTDAIIQLIKEKKEALIILDGLQRTFTMRDLIEEMKKTNETDELVKIESHKIRVEIYLGLNKLGILYRMLTLNTGQTKMSMRHQIEILYSDYLLNSNLQDIKLYTEADDTTPKEIGEYKFKDVVEGFNSFLTENYMTFERQDLLDNVENLEQLSKKNSQTDLFESFIKTYNEFSLTLKNKAPSWQFNDEGLPSAPFGKDVDKIFLKSQALTGFGAAIAKLISFNALSDLRDVEKTINDIDFTNIGESLDNLIIKLEEVRSKASKIGNDQRMFFFWFFRRLFDKDSDSYKNFHQSVEDAYKSYIRETQ